MAGPVDDVLGSSAEGAAIVARRWNAGAGPAILVIGAIHGDERESGHLPDVLNRRWQHQPERLGARHVILIMRLNPDGWHRKTRKSARRVDLNRNFPAGWRASERQSATHGGPAPLSEPEARIVHRLLTSEPIAAIVALHSCRRCGGVNNYDGPARKLAARMSELNGYKSTGEWPQPTPGSLGTFAGRDRGIPTVTLEMPRGMPGAGLVTNATAIEALIQLAGEIQL
ncbi:MAG: M14 family zinc carboxypeptidase [Pseudomonadota bacterium]